MNSRTTVSEIFTASVYSIFNGWGDGNISPTSYTKHAGTNFESGLHKFMAITC